MPIEYRRFFCSRKKKTELKPIFSTDNKIAAPANGNVAERSVQTKSMAVPPPAQKIRTGESKSIGSKGIAGLGVSISSVMAPKQEEQSVARSQMAEQSEKFTPLQLIKEWKAFAEAIDEEVHLKHTMLNCLPDLQEDGKTFVVILNNPVQEEALTKMGITLMDTLRRNLRNTGITMKVSIIVDDSEQKARFGTNKEKFDLMAEENPALNKLREEFGLEFT